MNSKKISKLLAFAGVIIFMLFAHINLEANAASPGLYDSDGKLIYSWSKLTGDSIVKGGILKVKNGTLYVTDNSVVIGQYYDEEWDCYEDIEKYACEFIEGKLVISSKVTAISDNCFSECQKLTGIVLPSKLKTIGEWAFAETAIQELNIPKSVTKIKPGITIGCNKLTKITVNSNNKIYNSKNKCNAIIKTSNKELIAACKKTVIPKGTKIIGESAFRQLNIKKITIPSGVKTIKAEAFSRCTYLEKVSFPSTLKTIGTGAFYFCDYLNDFTVPKSVTKIGDSAFLCVPVVHHQTKLKSSSWEADKVHKAVAGKCNSCGKKITVTFNANGGKTSVKTKKIYNKMTYLKMPTPTRKGYKFVGWYTKKTGGKRIYYTNKSVSTKSHTLYARWKLKK